MSTLPPLSDKLTGSSLSLSDYYSCPLCSKPFTTTDESPNIPLILPCCGQSVCAACFGKLLDSSGTKPVCPFDRIPIASTSGSEQPQLVRNRALIEVLERLGATTLDSGSESDSSSTCGNDCHNTASFYCQTCEHNYCTDCNELVHAHKTTRQHRRMPIAEKSSFLDSIPVVCLQHAGNPLAMFCQQCKEPVCSICIVLKHQNHAPQLVGMSDGIEWVRRTLNEVDEKALPIAELEEQRAQLRQEMAKVEQQRIRDVEKIMEETERQLERIHSLANAARKNIQLEIEDRTLQLSHLGGILEEKKRIGRVSSRNLLNALDMLARVKRCNVVSQPDSVPNASPKTEKNSRDEIGSEEVESSTSDVESSISIRIPALSLQNNVQISYYDSYSGGIQLISKCTRWAEYVGGEYQGSLCHNPFGFFYCPSHKNSDSFLATIGYSTQTQRCGAYSLSLRDGKISRLNIQIPEPYYTAPKHRDYYRHFFFRLCASFESGALKFGVHWCSLGSLPLPLGPPYPEFGFQEHKWSMRIQSSIDFIHKSVYYWTDRYPEILCADEYLDGRPPRAQNLSIRAQVSYHCMDVFGGEVYLLTGVSQQGPICVDVFDRKTGKMLKSVFFKNSHKESFTTRAENRLYRLQNHFLVCVYSVYSPGEILLFDLDGNFVKSFIAAEKDLFTHSFLGFDRTKLHVLSSTRRDNCINPVKLNILEFSLV